MRERQMVIGIDPAHGEDCGATMIAHIDGDVLVMDEFSAFSPEFVELLSRCFGREQATTWERAIEDYDPLPEDEIDPVSAQMRWIAGNTMRGESPLVEASRQMVNAEARCAQTAGGGLMNITPYAIAERHIGMREIPGSDDNPAILNMLKLDSNWPENDEVPWCSAFVNYCCWLLRLPRSKSLMARSWLAVGKPIYLPDARPGFDIVILSRGGGGSASGHCARRTGACWILQQLPPRGGVPPRRKPGERRWRAGLPIESHSRDSKARWIGRRTGYPSGGERPSAPPSSSLWSKRSRH